VPISYHPRRVDEGKKIRWTDGIDAVYVLMKCRMGA
jgi:dolichol-phosphate mannosyltransferase